MGYDLKPKNKELDTYSMGAFSWSWMLDSGVGLVLGTYPGIEPATYSYIPDKKGKDPRNNDGFYVTSKQAKIMSIVARGLVSGEKFKQKEWNEYPKEKQEQMKEWNEKLKIYKMPVREDFIDKVEKFADWAEISGGFWIK